MKNCIFKSIQRNIVQDIRLDDCPDLGSDSGNGGNSNNWNENGNGGNDNNGNENGNGGMAGGQSHHAWQTDHQGNPWQSDTAGNPWQTDDEAE